MTDFRITLSTEGFPDDRAGDPPEERATTGLLVVKAGESCLSQGTDNLIDARQEGPVVAGYCLAEWLLENWWRLRYEPRPSGPASDLWNLSHNFTGVGGGYVWPDITISSDGHRSLIRSKPSKNGRSSPFDYQGVPYPVILPWSSVEHGIDEFVGTVVALTAEKGLRDTDLDRLRKEVSMEREDPALGRFRRFEALLGADPDHMPGEAVEKHLSDAFDLGEDAVDELAADTAGRGIDSMLTAVDVREISRKHGVEIRVADSLASRNSEITVSPGSASAVEVGASAARQARELIGHHGKVNDRLLAESAGVSEAVFKPSDHELPISFTMPNDDNGRQAVLRQAPRRNQRFDLARLIGDALIWKESRMHPSTRAGTYRQKAQRAFAAEFLAPVEAVVAQMDGDYSDEGKQDVARRFGVSPMVIDGLLKNNGHIDRDDSDFANFA